MKKIIMTIMILISCNSMAEELSHDIKATPLIKVNKKDSEYNRICLYLNEKCNSYSAEIWKEGKISDAYYLIDKSPQVIKIIKDGNSYKVSGGWSFRDYHHSNEKKDNSDDILSPAGFIIYPAIYPIKKNKISLALVYKWETSYSGGGKEDNYADFIMLNNDNSYKVAFSDIPFSSKESIKACFKEDDYKKKSHCDDENWSVLSIKYQDTGKEYYEWEFVNKYYSWPAFEDKSKVKVEINKEKRYPFEIK
ncbi:hypothetical protein LF934_04485 [Dickeya dadantii]|uniref:hypothetical protein n=1 Tax=Dickeya dadantii TaxID=204038 RepID=UPI001CF38211|nr:hypothetical protein [Dickeya dadantii]MCA7011895.1 hypothetical protein [Dickeya dadantii]